MMFFDDGYDDYTNIGAKYAQVGGGLSNDNSQINTVAARNGTQGFWLNSGAGAGRNCAPGRQITLSNKTEFFDSFAIQIVTLGISAGQSFVIAAYQDAGTSQVEIQVDTVGHLIASRNGTVLGTSASTISFNAWHRIEVHVKIDPSAGIVQIKVDQAPSSAVYFLNLSGQNTRTSSNSFAQQFITGSNNLGSQANGLSIYYDDHAMYDTSGSTNNTFIGDFRVTTEMPTANGTLNNYTSTWASWAASTVMAVGQQIKDSNGNVQQVLSITSDFKTGSGSHPTWATTGGLTTVDNHVTWVVVGTGANPGAANWMAVSEIPPDDNNSYVTDATAGDQDRYTYPAVSGTQIFAVSVNARAEKDDAGVRTIRAVAKSGSTVADSGVDFGLTQSSYQYMQQFFETDPNTGAGWTQAGVNAAEFGVKTTN